MAWMMMSAATEPGSAVVLRFAVPKTVGMEVELVWMSSILTKNVPMFIVSSR